MKLVSPLDDASPRVCPRLAGAAVTVLALGALALDAGFGGGWPAEPFARLGWFAAWGGSGLVATSLLLMVREPVVAACFGGLQRMYRWHHGLGTVGYCLLLLHPLSLAGDALAQSSSAAAWRRIAPDPGDPVLLAGWLGLLALMAGLASSFALRLRYALWRRLHAVLGAGVLIGFGHVLAARGPASAAGALLLALALLALAWRVLRADLGAGARSFEVGAVRREAGNVVELRLRPLGSAWFPEPGGFVQVAFFDGPGYSGCGEFHPYTVSGVDAHGGLRIAVKALGDCTTRVQSLRPGVAALVQGPFGGFRPDAADADALWVAGGIGISPFVAALRAGRLRRRTELIYLVRSAPDAPFRDLLESIAAREPLLALRLIESGPATGPLTRALEQVPGVDRRVAWLCGPQPMVDAATAWLAAQGVPAANIHFERFDFR